MSFISTSLDIYQVYQDTKILYVWMHNILNILSKNNLSLSQMFPKT